MKINWKFWKKEEPPLSEWTFNVLVQNACLRIEHDLNFNTYKEQGLDLTGLTDEEIAKAYTDTPLYIGVLKGVKPDAQMVALARSGEYRKENS
jgi:hypothetical protein